MGNDLVGYRKPPRHSQFKPGESGNPKGRPRKRVGIREELLSELNEPAGEPEVTNGRVIVRQLVRTAAAGNLRAAIAILQLCPNADAGEGHLESATADGSLLSEYVERELRRRAPENTEGSVQPDVGPEEQ